MRHKYKRDGSIEIEWEKEPNVLLVGTFDEADHSFDHAFGTRREIGLELREMTIFMFIDNFEYDVTSHFETKEPGKFERLKNDFIEYAQKKGLLSA